MAIMRLKDICTKIGSGATPRGGKGAYVDSGISLIRSQNVLDFSFSYAGLAYINEEQAARLTSELSEMFAKSHELENEIRKKLGAIGYEI